MQTSKYDHLSLVRHNGNIILVTGREQRSEKPKRWYHFGGRNPVWHYSGKILDATDPNCPKFTREVEGIPEGELKPLVEDERITHADRTARF